MKTTTLSCAAAAGVLAAASAYAVRGRSSQFFGPCVYRGPGRRRSIALTFDDGPSEGTPELLELLREYNVNATFFLCGRNVERLPFVARRIVAYGHELGNHSYSHPRLYGKRPEFVQQEFIKAQDVIEQQTGISPWILRPPYGARWFGLGAVQRQLALLGIMWTVIGNDWQWPAARIARYVLDRAKPGGIVCLHDGRETQVRPNISTLLAALREILPVLVERGYKFEIVSDLLRPDAEAVRNDLRMLYTVEG